MTHIRPVAALLLGSLLGATPAFAQSPGDATAGQSDRLQRLETQVAALGGPVEVAQLSPSVAADFEIRLQNLERSMSELTGRYEETNHQLAQLRERLEKMNGDIDFRLKDLESKGGGAMGGAMAGGAMGGGAMAGGAMDGAPKSPAKADDRKSADKPSQTAAAAPPAAPPSTAGLTPEKQYEQAFELLRNADYDRAEKALQDFIAKNKSHAYAGNAQYWLGESYYVRNRFPEAAQAFAEVLSKYRTNPKAADSLLKLGMALQQMNKKSDACTAFGQLLNKFPEASASVKRRADTERKRINCPA
ncbi:tol-pal system protein YbgF [Azospirillum picis]|uniref:Cell division coordinator CpoB n=1 Tax=Azospirillum picis TaxID=488438 RepID=A0ABU0MEN6_9PROT|nr:tol-pal system protein YbgF [Azospirillum picis]MBP2298049.1 tol-pal system protein YbgF [Azospirillum picis]MDQ0531887.1 tol-pal system protein YbgF [Azospirillum picis]